jgi:muramidase (phage lysozyme)
MPFMVTHALIGRQSLIAAVIAGSIPLVVPPAPSTATLLPPNSRAQLLSEPGTVPSRAIPFVITPERRAMLNTIRFAEGTWKGGLDVGYRVMFGGGLMPSLDRHPNRVIYRSRYASAAAGAYQFMPFTWNLVKRSIGVRGFGPEAQDQGALFLIQRRKALGLTDAGTLTPLLTAKLAPEWASFPTLAGRSFYGQPVKKYSRLRSFYTVNLQELRRIRDLKRQQLALELSPPPAICTGSRIACATQL